MTRERIGCDCSFMSFTRLAIKPNICETATVSGNVAQMCTQKLTTAEASTLYINVSPLQQWNIVGVTLQQSIKLWS